MFTWSRVVVVAAAAVVVGLLVDYLHDLHPIVTVFCLMCRKSARFVKLKNKICLLSDVNLLSIIVMFYITTNRSLLVFWP